MLTVKFLSEGQIEKAAMQLMAGHVAKFGPVSPPVPVDEILECHLGLSFGIEDLREYGPDVLGATWLQTGRVAVDQSLDPSTFPDKEGRYRFTLAHELGHFELHAHQLRDNGQATLFTESNHPTIVCRSSAKREPIEWQADQFAAQLLMPREMVYTYWRELFGDRPYVAVDEIARLSERFGSTNRKAPTVSVARDMADHFAVSGQAMQIRLETLGLIRTKPAEPELF